MAELLPDCREKDAFDLPGQILQDDEAHHAAFFGRFGANGYDHAAHFDLHAVFRQAGILPLGKLRQEGCVMGQTIKHLGVFIQRMTGDIHPRQLFFKGEHGVARIILDVGIGGTILAG